MKTTGFALPISSTLIPIPFLFDLATQYTSPLFFIFLMAIHQ
jgi:heme/copper-type cytochrome/quinol oxidase subunit 4